MIDDESDFPKDAVTGIKSAMDREVTRRFDAERLAAVHTRTIERARTGRDAFRDRSNDGRATSRSGPFSRVPVPLQWLGLAAAIVAAVAGIRSLTREWTASPPAQVAASGSAGTAEVSEQPSVVEDSDPSAAPAVPPVTSPEAPPERSLQSERDRAPEPPPADEPPAHAASGPLAPSPHAPSTDSTSPGGSTIAGANSSPPTRIAGGTSAPQTAPAPGPKVAPGASMVATGALPSGVDAVRVAGQRLQQQGLLANVYPFPAMKVVFVWLRAVGPRVVPKDAATTRIPGLLGQQNRGEDARIPDLSADPGLERARPARDERPPTADDETAVESADRARGRVAAPRKKGAFYVRAFIGSAMDLVPRENYGYLGKTADAIALRRNELWGDSEGLRRLFRMRSLVAVDGAFVRADSKGYAEGELLVAAARRVYAIDLKGEPAEGPPSEHTVTVRISRLFVDGAGEAGASEMEIPVILGNGAIAVLCIQDQLLGERWDGRGQPNLLLVAVSPRFSDLAPAPEVEPFPSDERGSDPAVVVDRVEPQFPEDARLRGIRGEIVLGATVLRNGSVDGVHVLSLPRGDGAEMLIEPASIALRRWRFLPAQVQGEPVDSLVTVTIDFRPDRDPRR